MMNQLFLISILFCSLVSSAQFDKKTLKTIEKQAVFLPVDTLIITSSSVGVGANIDSLFGKTVVNSATGWGRYHVNLEGGKPPKPIQDGTGFKREMPSYIQNKVGGNAVSRFEISNKEYRMFVDWTRQNNPTRLAHILLDTFGWKRMLGAGELFGIYYHSHPAYNDYPVVNISHEQAREYLVWLTDQYNNSPNRKYKKVLFRLPTEAEWMYAYLGKESEYMATYKGFYRKENGQLTANFVLYTPESQIKLQDSTYLLSSDTSLKMEWQSSRHTTMNYDTFSYTFTYKPEIFTLPGFSHQENWGMYTSPAKSYWPNSAGLYTMAGNVAEFVAEEGIIKGGHWNTTGYYLKPTSRETYLGNASQSPTRGFRWVMEVIEE